MVIIVMNRESAIWRKASLKTVIRENQLKQIKHDKVENVVMDGSKVGKSGKN